jgi:hypothetical protein
MTTTTNPTEQTIRDEAIAAACRYRPSLTGTVAAEAIGDAVARDAAGRNERPGAAKRGRNPEYPYVPLIRWTDETGTKRTRNAVPGTAFTTREEALDFAARELAKRLLGRAVSLAIPTERAYREHFGLPRDLDELMLPVEAEPEPPSHYKVRVRTNGGEVVAEFVYATNATEAVDEATSRHPGGYRSIASVSIAR